MPAVTTVSRRVLVGRVVLPDAYLALGAESSSTARPYPSLAGDTAAGVGGIAECAE